MSSSTDDYLYRPAEAAAALGISVRALYRLWARYPDFPVVRLNARCYRIPAWRLRQWLDAHAGGPAAEPDGVPVAPGLSVVGRGSRR